jgi:hypothetical protein
MSSNGLNGKAALVTGGSRGIGQGRRQHRSSRHDVVKPFCNRRSKIYESLTKSV